MLIEFKVKNFRSFREEAVLSMVASTDKTLPENTIAVPEFGHRNLLRSAVIYGANAAGKSNLIAAINFFDGFIATSTDRKPGEKIDVKPFALLAQPNNEPSEFEISFLDDHSIRYQYGFHVTSERVVREWLIAYPKGLPQTWFERAHTGSLDAAPEWSFGRNLKGKNSQVAELTRPDVLFLSNATNLNHRQLAVVFKWLQQSLRIIDADDLDSVLVFLSSVKMKQDARTRNDIRRLLQVADLGITDLDIQEKTYTEKDLPEDMPSELRNDLLGQILDKKHLEVFMRHSIGNGSEVLFPLNEESSGTQRMFALSGPIAEVLENGWTLFVDELDASLHPLLVRYLVELFHNPQINPKGAQLIFNTHDTTLMDCCLFRRDQIWFVEKDRQGCSHLYPLLDYSPRKNESLAKGYLIGRYGAIPFLGDPSWGEGDDARP
jgi:AAA15 family ATPase/GTPase